MVFNVARDSTTTNAYPSLFFIGSDEFTSAQSNARRIFAEAKADGVTIQRGVCANQNANLSMFATRCAGAATVFEEHGVLLDNFPISSDISFESGARDLAEYFAAHPETNALLLTGGASSVSYILYVEETHLPSNQLYATTFDAFPVVFDLIDTGHLVQAIDQQQYIQGFQTIISLYLYHKYGLRPSGFINTSSIVDLSNVNSVRELYDLGVR